ncbi:MAG TPA: nitroreductase family protein [Fimbriimonas sp.]|nr:nitroreductase family protein [Fimbriimonas sp.]
MSRWPETPEEAWRMRFGTDPPQILPQIGDFLMHRSVREYSDRPVSEDLVTGLLGAAQSAATSSNLQLYSIVSVQEPARRAEIARLCAGYEHVRKAPWFFAFIVDHHRLRHAARVVGEEAAGLSYLEFLIMAVVDAALAAERLVCAAESLGLGICYIGALRDHAPEVKELLRMPDGTFGAFGLCLGWPEEPVTAHIKPRLNQSSIWYREYYDRDPEIAEYDERLADFHRSEQMKGPPGWSKRSGRRVDRHHLTGREILKDWLAEQGMGTE